MSDDSLRELYREALAVRASYGGHVAQLAGRRSLTDGELVAYINDVLDRRPDARCTQERVVAVWLNRLVVAEDRWHRTWQQVVSARGMAAARTQLGWECGTSNLPPPASL